MPARLLSSTRATLFDRNQSSLALSPYRGGCLALDEQWLFPYYSWTLSFPYLLVFVYRCFPFPSRTRQLLVTDLPSEAGLHFFFRNSLRSPGNSCYGRDGSCIASLHFLFFSQSPFRSCYPLAISFSHLAHFALFSLFLFVLFHCHLVPTSFPLSQSARIFSNLT